MSYSLKTFSLIAALALTTAACVDTGREGVVLGGAEPGLTPPQEGTPQSALPDYGLPGTPGNVTPDDNVTPDKPARAGGDALHEQSVVDDDRLLTTYNSQGSGFSADGSRLYYAKDQSGLASSLYVTDVWSGETRHVSDEAIVIFPWEPVLMSPDGERMLFRKTFTNGGGSWHHLGELWLWTWDGGTVKSVNDDVFKGAYRWSPDGQRMIYADSADRTLTVADKSGETLATYAPNVFAGGAQSGWEVFPMSADSRYLAYVTGNSSTGTLRLVDLWTETDLVLDANVDGRTVQFIDSHTLIWVEKTEVGAQTRVRNLPNGAVQTLNPGNFHQIQADADFVAYNVDDALYVWSRATGQAAQIEAEVAKASHYFTGGGYLTYLKHAGPKGGDQADLWSYELATKTSRLVQPDISQGWLGQPRDRFFGHAGTKVVIKLGPCDSVNTLLVIDLVTGEETSTTGAYGCMAPYFRPDDSGVVYHTSDGVRVLDLASGVSQPAGEGSAYLYIGDGQNHTYRSVPSEVGTIETANWVTGKQRCINGALLPTVMATSDTHLLYRHKVQDSKVWLLRLAELP